MTPDRIGRIILLALLPLVSAGCVPANDVPVVLHENPACAEERYSASPLFAELGDVLQSAENGEKLSLSALVRLSETDAAHLPGAVVDSMGGYLGLLNDVATSLRTLQKSVEVMSEALRVGDLALAEETLEKCELAHDRITELMPDLRNASMEMISSLKRERHLVSAAALAALEERFTGTLEAFDLQLEQSREQLEESHNVYLIGESLEEPLLRLVMQDEAVWVGQTIHVSGSLCLGGEPMPGQEVQFLVDDVVSEAIVTDEAGGFSHAVTLPAIYAPSCLLCARFVPQPEDALRLRGTTSEGHTVTLRYHEATIDCALDSALYPGLIGRVSGSARSLGTQSGRNVLVTLDGIAVGHSATDGRGAFYCSFAVPPDVKPGAHMLAVSVEGDDVQSIAPAAHSEEISVERLAPAVSIPFTPLLFVPSPGGGEEPTSGLAMRGGALSVYGTVDSTLPLSAPSASLEWGDTTVDTVVSGNSIELTVPPGRVRWAVGPQVMTVNVVPEEPWHQPSEVHVEFFVVNLYMLVGGIAVLCALIAFARLRRRDSSVARGALARPAQPRIRRERPAAPSRGGRATYRELVVRFYYQAVLVVEHATGVHHAPELTLREFLAAVGAHAATPMRMLGRLTRLAETALYSRREPSSAQSRMAGRLAAAIGAHAGTADAPAEVEAP